MFQSRLKNISNQSSDARKHNFEKCALALSATAADSHFLSNKIWTNISLFWDWRPKQSDFFIQWTRRKMKIPLERHAVNISKLMGGKNEKARREALHENLRLDLYFVYRKYWMEIKITEYVICKQEAFYIIEI